MTDIVLPAIILSAVGALLVLIGVYIGSRFH